MGVLEYKCALKAREKDVMKDCGRRGGEEKTSKNNKIQQRKTLR